MKNQMKHRELHALDDIKFIDASKSWEARVSEEWMQPMSFDWRIQWLHMNGTREGNGPEKALFYLSLADRYGEPDLFSGNQDYYNLYESLTAGILTIDEMRKKLSQKAFTVLANTFFRQTDTYTGLPYILPYIDPLFSKLLWFFRPSGDFGGWDNLRPRDVDDLGKDGGRHYVELANNFARDFAHGAWDLLNGCWSRHWDTNLDGGVTRGHEYEIIILMRRLGDEKYMQGQHKPLPEVFYRMVRIVVEEELKLSVNDSDLMDSVYVENTLRSLAKRSSFARFLYLIRLDIEIE